MHFLEKEVRPILNFGVHCKECLTLQHIPPPPPPPPPPQHAAPDWQVNSEQYVSDSSYTIIKNLLSDILRTFDVFFDMRLNKRLNKQ